MRSSTARRLLSRSSRLFINNSNIKQTFLVTPSNKLFHSQQFVSQAVFGQETGNQSSFQQQFSASDNANSLKLQLLDTAVTKYVHTLGWSAEALNMAAQDLNLSRMSVSQLLNNSEYELVEYFITKCNQHMSRTIQLKDTSQYVLNY
jgi:hypothetical protein